MITIYVVVRRRLAIVPAFDGENYWPWTLPIYLGRPCLHSTGDFWGPLSLKPEWLYAAHDDKRNHSYKASHQHIMLEALVPINAAVGS